MKGIFRYSDILNTAKEKSTCNIKSMMIFIDEMIFFIIICSRAETDREAIEAGVNMVDALYGRLVMTSQTAI